MPEPRSNDRDLTGAGPTTPDASPVRQYGWMLLSPLRSLSGAAPRGLPVVRAVVRNGLGRVFGPPPFDASADPGDPGLLGANAVTGRVIAEPAAIPGGLRSLLVQLCHPHAMAGVADHSGFREDPLGRLHSTTAYVTTTAFASTPQALAAARAVREAHTLVHGIAPDGQAYRADEPRLLVWVSLALTSSFLATDRAYAPVPLDSDSADAFVAEQSRAAALLDPRVDLDALGRDPAALTALRAGGLDLPLLAERHLPRTVAELDDRIAAYRPQLAVNEQGRQALRFLRWPPVDPATRAGYLPVLAAAVATLEGWQRRLLGLPLPDLAARGARAGTLPWLAGVRLAAGLSPALRAAAERSRAA